MPENHTHQSYDEFLDATGLNCPLPVLKTKLALNRMQPGEVLRIDATDPHSIIDFKAYCARSGHEIIHLSDTNKIFTFYIKHKPQK